MEMLSISAPSVTVTVSVANTSTLATLPTGSADSSWITVYNETTFTAFVTTGVTTATATTANMFVQAGTTQTFAKPVGHNAIAVIIPGGTGNVYAAANGAP